MKWISILLVVCAVVAGANAVLPTTRTIRTSEGDVVLEDILAGASGGGGLRTLPEGSGLEAAPKIVGGSVVSNIKKFPQVVAIVGRDKRGRDEVECSGVIIDKHVVLTAAQCAQRLNNSQLTFFACSGTVNIKKDTKNSKCGQILSAWVWVPKKFKHPSLGLDFGLLRLKQSILSSSAKRVKVSFAKPKNGLAGFAVGFGKHKGGKQADGKMRSNAVKVILNEGQCKVLDDRTLENDSKFICGERAGACTRDEGGPLLVKKNNDFICVGISSLVGCNKGKESVYNSLYNKAHAKAFKAGVKAVKGKFLTATLPKK